MSEPEAIETKKRVAEQTPERIGPGLYRRGDKIFARVTIDGKRTFRSTSVKVEGNSQREIRDAAAEARKILHEWRKQQVLKEHGIEPKVAA